MDLTEYYIIALDVGKTFTRSAVLDEQGRILPDSFSIFSTKASESNESILGNFVKIIKFNINSILHPDFKIKRIGFSFSNAFIFENEEKILQNKRLKDSLMKVPSIEDKLSPNCQFLFEEDARLFAMGENILRENKNPKKRVLYLIIGSSLSSAYMIDGQLILKDYDAVETRSFEEGMVRDYISSRGMLAIAKKVGITQEGLRPKDLEIMALNGDSKALQVFELFGEYLGRALSETITNFSPDEIILGGNLALSYPLFSRRFEKSIMENNIQVIPTKFTSHYIFFGISERVKKN